MNKFKRLLLSNSILCFLFLFIIIYIWIFTGIIKYSSKLNNETNLEGKIIAYSLKEDRLSLTIKSTETVLVNYYIKNSPEKEYLRNIIGYGNSVKLLGKLKEPNNNTVPNTFNYKKYLYNKKIYKVFSADSILVKKNNSIFYKFKNMIYKKISNCGSSSSYLLAILLGDKSALNKDAYDSFKKNGVLHLFAISGMHISFFIKIIKLCFKNFSSKIIDAVIIIFSYLYAWLVNFPASILRVAVFLTLEFILSLFKIKMSNVKKLLFSAFFLLIINPFFIYDLGFIYSFILMFFIYSFSLKGKTKLLKLSALTFLASAPITIYNFYKINLLAIIINILSGTLVSAVIFPLILLTLIFNFFEPILNLALMVLEKGSIYLAKINFLTFVIAKPSIIFVLIYYVVLYLVLKKIKLKYFGLLFIVIMIMYLKKFCNTDYRMYFFDVDQGDSSVYISPFNKKVIMIDTGGKINYSNSKLNKSSYYVSDNIIVFLNSLGISKINLLIITHGDYDHMGEAINLVENFKVEKVIFNCGVYNDLEKELINVLDKKKIPYYSCIKELNIDDNKLYFLNNNDYGNENDNSSVIYTELNNHKFLFMGDAGVEVEEELIKKYNLKDIDVLKVGHHGSRTSSSKVFIDEVNPKYSIISVGKNNRYGHPNKEVLSVLDKSKIYRTDKQGSIMFKIKNNKLKLETCSP